MLCCLLRKKATVRLTWGGFDWALIRRILAFGFPTFLIFSTDSIILIILNGLLQHYGGALEGDILVTCATIVQSWFSLISLPMGGITTGSQPVVSYTSARTGRSASSAPYSASPCCASYSAR